MPRGGAIKGKIDMDPVQGLQEICSSSKSSDFEAE